MLVQGTSETVRSSKTIPPVDVGSHQLLIVIRHGDRYDFAHPDKWAKTNTKRKHDPPLSSLGHRQARETGRFLDSYFTEIGIHADNVTLLSSPFLRTIQTADNILDEFVTTPGDVAERVKILPDNSVWELDGGGLWNYHSSLPSSMEERGWYYPRVDDSYQSLFTPTLPESREDFLHRCDRVMQELHNRFDFVEKSAIIVVTHAAGCVALARAAANLTLQEINPAPPCGMYILTRSCNTPIWSLDHHSIPSGANGFVGHVSDLGRHTFPWNHFGNKKENNGYTGPTRNDLESL